MGCSGSEHGKAPCQNAPSIALARIVANVSVELQAGGDRHRGLICTTETKATHTLFAN